MTIEGLIIGLSVGASCVASCGPLIMSVIMKNSPTPSDAYSYLGRFMVGRLMAYLAIAAVTGLMRGCQWQSARVMAVMSIAVGVMMIVNALVKLPSYCAKGVGVKTYIRSHAPMMYVPALGFISSINICPPVIAAATASLNAPSTAQGIGTFVLFFIGSSIYMLPLPLISLFEDKEAIRTIGRFMSWIIGVMFIVKGLIGL